MQGFQALKFGLILVCRQSTPKTVPSLSPPANIPGWRATLSPPPPLGRLIRNAMTFESYLHWTFHDEHFLFSSIVLNSPLSFLLACLLVILICLLERLKSLFFTTLSLIMLRKLLYILFITQRFLTFFLDKNWALQAFKLKPSFTCLAIWRTGLYSIVTFLRL